MFFVMELWDSQGRRQLICWPQLQFVSDILQAIVCCEYKYILCSLRVTVSTILAQRQLSMPSYGPQEIATIFLMLSYLL